MTPEQRKLTRTIIRQYLLKAEANKADIHYDQFRPLTSLGDPPSTEFTTDCSGLVISAFKWADIWTPFVVKDPGGYGYLGWGNTTSILATNRKRRVPEGRMYFVGDMALYGTSLSHTTHVTICYKNGNEHTSEWMSHGQEAGPFAVRLKYRKDYLLVVRSEALA